ncbi:CAAX prenyl protease 2 [Gryllus bimaculatus]|nr:CAAX prenyl protease 2 [Gryllus bimaculatus]
MEGEKRKVYPCVSSVAACFFLSVIYVASLYVWNSPLNRNHPSTIKKRFFSVFIMMFISPLFLYCFSSEEMLQDASLLQLMGFRLAGLLPALILPLGLTMVLFLGPLSMQGLSGLWKLYAEPMYWVSNAKSLIWLRNHVVAPLSEELTFRACMLPLLLQCFRPLTAVFICPLFFGVGFQFSYTTMFGAYSAFLFAKTGHFVAPFAAHAFCNHMGFPDFGELLTYQKPQRILLMSLFVVGLLSWCLLLTPLTTPSIYSNQLFWRYH